MISANHLRDYSLFSELNDDEFSHLAPHFSKRMFAKGAYLFYPGSPSINLYLVESGLIRLFFTNTVGQEFLLDLAGPRAVLGLPISYENQTRIVGAAALHPSTVLVLAHQDLDYFIQRYPHFTRNINVLIHTVFCRLMVYVRSMATISLNGRLATMLLYMSQDKDKGVQDELELPLSQAEIATWIGCSRGALNRTLSHLQQLGLIRIDGQKYIILDRTGLQQMTEDLLLDPE
jgi:CRP/FNR family transcriptional regulator